ncbi:hypothetical protein, partial [Listeria seeligeri]|uniref:hypothetical protein n=1 Tax=Listeria seeligeri TaxID=1640 RepID=UPI001BD941EC
ASSFISTGYITLVLTKNTSVNFILHEFNESVFLLFSFFSGSAELIFMFNYDYEDKQIEKSNKERIIEKME